MINNCLTDELDGMCVEPSRTRIWDGLLLYFVSLVDSMEKSKNFVLLYLHKRRYLDSQIQSIQRSFSLFFHQLRATRPALASFSVSGDR